MGTKDRGKRKIRVLFITHVTGMAGANRSMLQLIEELRELYNVTPVVLLPCASDDGIGLKQKLETRNITYIETEIKFFKQGEVTVEKGIDYLRLLRGNGKFYKRLVSYSFDIIHSNSSVIDVGAYLSRQLGCIHVWHLRDFGDLDYGLYSVLGDKYERFTYKKGDCFIAISNAVKEHFASKIDVSRIHVIYNGISEDMGLEQAKHKDKKIQFLCAGVICEGKNQKEILLAVDELVNRRNVCGFHLTLVGLQSLYYVKTLEDFICQKGLQNYVTILQEMDGIAALLARMDVGIVPSVCEAFGRVTVEYMLQNLAVIVSDSGANPEIVNGGEVGMIYQLGNPMNLAEKMQLFINDRNQILMYAKRGRIYAKSHFLSSYNSKRIYELYSSVLGKETLCKKISRNVQKIEYRYFLNLALILWENILKCRRKEIV